MSEYRLDELARLSGVSARNIRAYRERGLLEPPRRIGRSAVYSESHLAQLDAINQLLRRGFNSTHIAEFFAGVREGADLADVLGLQRITPGGRASAALTVGPAAADHRLVIAVGSDEASRLQELGLTRIDGGTLRLVDPVLAEIVGRAADQMIYVRALLRIVESASDGVDALAAAVVAALEEGLAAGFGPDNVTDSAQLTELSRVVQDYRALANKLVIDHFATALHRRLTFSGSGALLDGGQWPTPTH